MMFHYLAVLGEGPMPRLYTHTPAVEKQNSKDFTLIVQESAQPSDTKVLEEPTSSTLKPTSFKRCLA